MGSKDVQELKTLAVRFRKAIESCDKKLLPITLKEFPNGACGDAALLLGRFFKDAGFGWVDYVSGKYKQQWHAWLEKNNLIIDITADQFEEITDKVIVTENNEWHRKFKVHTRHKADFELYDQHTVSMLMSAYKRVVGCLAAV